MYDTSRTSRSKIELACHVIVLLLLTIGASSSSHVESGVARSTIGPFPGSSGCYLDDRCTLRTFKKGLRHGGEPALSSWSNSNVSLWKGVTWTTAGDGTVSVKKLELGGLNLNGTSIAPLLKEGLTNLTTLNISGNFLAGELPDPLRLCPALLVLDLSNNSFSGPLPQVLSCDDTANSSAATLSSVIYTAINLEVLNLSRNNFSGSISSDLFSPELSSGGSGGSLGNLTSLNLGYNSFEGSFPSSIGNCVALVELKLAFNRLTNQFPFSALDKLEYLETVDVTSNFFTGNLDIPADGKSFRKLKFLKLGYNWLRGGIPESIGNFSSLQVLELKYNNLTGIIPNTLGRLANLEILNLQFNNLNGSIPEEISHLSSLATLSLNYNMLTGYVPTFLSNCTNLRSIWMSQNMLSGAIAPELGNMTNLVVLSLYGNYFNTSIPEELGRSTNLVALDLS